MDKTTKAPPAPPIARVVVVSGDNPKGRAVALAAALSLGAVPILTRDAVPPAGHERGMPPPSRGTRSAIFSASTYDGEARTVEAVFSSGSPVRRWFGVEQLSMEADAIDLNRVAANLCPFLNAHNAYDIGAVLGRIVSARLEGGQLVGTIQFADTDAGRLAEGMVSRGELLGISIGYAVRTWQLTESTEDLDTWTAASWELLEVSLVPVPADPNAGVRSVASTPGQPAANGDIQEDDDDMLRRNLGGGDAANPAAPAAPAIAAPAAPVATRTEPAAPAAPAIQAPATVTGADVRTAATNAGLDTDATLDLLERHSTTPFTRDALMADIGRRFAERDSGARTTNRVSVSRDAGDTMRRGMGDAIFHRITPGAELSDVGREFRGMSLLRMAEELLVSTGVSVRGMSPNEIAERSLTTTSDLPALMANGMNRRLRSSYEENQPSYRRWARRAPNAPNFKSIDVIQMSSLPDLLKVNESGEVKYGSVSDGIVSYKVLTYARAIGFTRQTIVNDDLRAMERVVTGFAGASSRLENRTVYAGLTANAPMPDTVALFHATHGNLAAAGAVISAAALGAGRTRMRLQKGLQNEELNLMPSFLIVPATQEQLAYQFTSSQYVPAKQSDTNEFRQGGRTAVEPIVEAILDGVSTTAWYMAADSASVDTVEYCYLDGAEGPQIASRLGFTTDGVEFKATLDFASAVIDYRGLDKNPGA